MRIVVNGEEREVISSLSVEKYIESLGLSLKRVVVEYNGEVLSKEKWKETVLKEGDKLEIVHFVGGG
ncbi:Sulfur carrier protein ThiS [Brevinematales bacterium NS]|nr:sulfur carrier protein ThiS [Brevinematales bacterium]QJR21888.1 Sulfur carrier protein ThiS [Brevinematales bacterium NS]